MTISTPFKIVLLAGLFALYYLVPLEFRALWQPDETRYAEISREMLLNGNWVTPHFLDLRYFEKPAAGYWINNLGQWLFGHNNFAVRIGSVFSTLISALLVYRLGYCVFKVRETALIASMIFLTSLLVYGVGTYAVLDPMLTLWLVAAMCSYWSATGSTNFKQRVLWFILLGFACGMGFMTKGFLALAVPVLAIFPWACWQRRLKELLAYGPIAIAAAAVISAPWAIAIQQQQPDFWHYFFWVEHIQRFAEVDAQHKAPFWYYLPILLAGSLPWLALLPGSLRSGWNHRHISPGSLYLLSWVVIPLLFFSIAKGKLPTYILPCFAPLALLIAHHGQELAQRQSRTLTVNAWINVLFGLLVALTLLTVLAPWGLTHRPLFRADEIPKLALAVGAFIAWAVAGYCSAGVGKNRWLGAALCPLVLALCVGQALPERVQNTKQPQLFLHDIADKLKQSRYILSDEPGVASALAWTLQRSDILLYNQQGELRYGLSYPDAPDRYVSAANFDQWLAQRRRSGTVSIVLKLDNHDERPQLPPADFSYQRDRLLYLQYQRAP